MPLRAYTPVRPPCRLCGAGFEIMQTARAPTLTECPRCGQPVQPCAGAIVHTPKATRRVPASDAKAAGFTVLKRIGKGEYEKQ